MMSKGNDMKMLKLIIVGSVVSVISLQSAEAPALRLSDEAIVERTVDVEKGTVTYRATVHDYNLFSNVKYRVILCTKKEGQPAECKRHHEMKSGAVSPFTPAQSGYFDLLASRWVIQEAIAETLDEAVPSTPVDLKKLIAEFVTSERLQPAKKK
jgi:hypothetical protein